MDGERTKKLIGVSMLTLQVQFHRELKEGLEKEAQAAGYDLLVAVGNFNAGEQASQIRDFILEKKVDALVVTPCDSAGIGSTIELSNKANIPVFTTDIASSSGYGKVVSHIGSDNYLGGKKAGELMAKALKGQGNIIITMHPGVTSIVDRVRGFKDAISKEKGLRLLGEIPVWTEPRNVSAKVLKDMFTKTLALDGVFCINDEFAMGAVAAVEAAHNVGKIAIVGYDATSEVRQAIKKGLIYGDVIQHPGRIGELTIGAIRDHFAGKRVPPLIPVDVGVYTAAEAGAGV